MGAPRHTVSLRWLGACVLTGVAGVLFLGAAIYVSSQGEMTFAELAERAVSAGPRGGNAGSASAARKADKLIRAETVAAAKQSFRAPMTMRTADREVIRIRSFTRISTGLSMTAGLLATDIPPFNPMRFFTDTGSDRIPDPLPETSDAEVSVTKSDLATLAIDPSGTGLRDDQAAAQALEAARVRSDPRRVPTIVAPLASLMRALAATSPQAVGPSRSTGPQAAFRSIDVQVMPENVTNFAKLTQRASEAAYEDRTVPIRRGDTLDAILRANGAGPDDARTVSGILVGRDRNGASPEGGQLRLLAGPAARPGEPRPLVRATLLSERGIEAIAATNDRGTFVSVTPPSLETARQGTSRDESDEEDEGSGPTVYQSLYETAAKQDISRATVEDLIRIFGYDVDFQRRVTPGDSFELFVANDEEGGGERPEILTAALTIGSEVHRVYRYTGDDGTVDFFDEAGRSLKKFLLRKPVVEARMSSPFGVRFHPILGYAKMHTGVDWAAPWGTPIFATGNGTVVKAEMSSGYGRRVEVQHANGYVSTYNHMSAFARGVNPGAKLRQGQLVGYVGSIGLSTGPHVHYEVVVNGHFVDPMKIRVPRGRELDGRALADFSRQRDQVDGLVAKTGAPNRLAQTDLR